MNSGDRVGEATIRRYIDRGHDLLISRGHFGALFAAYVDHARRWDKEPDGLSQTFMRQGLGAAALHLANRPKGESVGWTIQIHRPPTNSRMYVQTTRSEGRPSASTIEVFGLDILEMFERYYVQSVQTPARFVEIDEESFLMLLALPDADHEWLRRLSRDEAIGVAEDDVKPLGEATFRFQCGCSPERMLEVTRNLFRDDPNELFRGDPGVEISCPRCGRRWWIDRAQFDAIEGSEER